MKCIQNETQICVVISYKFDLLWLCILESNLTHSTYFFPNHFWLDSLSSLLSLLYKFILQDRDIIVKSSIENIRNWPNLGILKSQTAFFLKLKRLA